MLLRWIYETVVSKIIFLLCHADSFVLPYFTFFSIDWNKKKQPRTKKGWVKRSEIVAKACAVLLLINKFQVRQQSIKLPYG